MAIKSSWGIRNPKNSDNHWDKIDLSSYKMKKPLVVCMSGNGSTYERDANGFCKICENLLGLKIDSENSEEIYEYVDLMGVSYSCLGVFGPGQLKKRDINAFVDNILLPLCVDDNGQKLDVGQACKNIAAVTFFTYCHGSVEVCEICNLFHEKLITDYGYTKDETMEIFNAMREVSYSPNTLNSFCPKVAVYSSADEERLWVSNYDFGDKQVAMDIQRSSFGHSDNSNNFYPEYNSAFDVLNILVRSLTDSEIGDDHYVNVLRRNEKWELVEDQVKADCVSQMMAYALARFVADGVKNFNSDTYIPRTNISNLKVELSSIMNSFNLDSEKVVE